MNDVPLAEGHRGAIDYEAGLVSAMKGGYVERGPLDDKGRPTYRLTKRGEKLLKDNGMKLTPMGRRWLT